MIIALYDHGKLDKSQSSADKYLRYSQHFRRSRNISDKAIPYIKLVEDVRSNLSKLNMVIDDLSIHFEEKDQQMLFSKQRVSNQ